MKYFQHNRGFVALFSIVIISSIVSIISIILSARAHSIISATAEWIQHEEAEKQSESCQRIITAKQQRDPDYVLSGLFYIDTIKCENS